MDKKEFLKDPKNIERVVDAYDFGIKGIDLPLLNAKEVNYLVSEYCKLPDREEKYLNALLEHGDSEESYSLPMGTIYCLSRSKESLLGSRDLEDVSFYLHTHSSVTIGVGDGEELLHEENRRHNHIISLSKRVFEENETPLEAFEITAKLSSLVDEYGRIGLLFDPDIEEGKEITPYIYGNPNYFEREKVTQMIFMSLYEGFEKRGISLYEGCLEYLKEKINPLMSPNEVRLRDMVSEGYYFKCVTLFTHLDSLLSQYRCLIEYGSISQALLEKRSPITKPDEYPSMMENKYYSLRDDSLLHSLRHILFSPFSALGRLSYKLGERRFYDYLIHQEIRASDFVGEAAMEIAILLDSGIIVEDAAGLRFANDETEEIWDMLYSGPFLTVSSLTPYMANILERYVGQKWCFRYTYLFSNDECLFLNYWLNNSGFFLNARALRNKYIHGQAVFRDERKCKEDYMMGLRILMICLIKIHDDLAGKGPRRDLYPD